MCKNTRRFIMTDYTINAGDTLSKIAKANGTTVQKLAKLNNITNPDKILAGAVLKLPKGTDAVVLNQNIQGDNSPSNKTQTRNENMKNLKTAYDTLMKRFDIIDLPVSDKAKFKQDVQGAYQAHIMNNEFPKTVANPAEFAADLMLEALKNVPNGDSMEADIIKLASNLFPNDKIGGLESRDLQSGAFVKETNSEGNEILALSDDIKKANTANIKDAYQTILGKLDTLKLPDGVNAVDLKNELEEILPAEIKNLPEGSTTPAEFTYSLLQEAFKGLSENDNRAALTKIAAQLYPKDTIGGQKCSDLQNKPFSIVDNQLVFD